MVPKRAPSGALKFFGCLEPAHAAFDASTICGPERPIGI
jgi:hypothetical protein